MKLAATMKIVVTIARVLLGAVFVFFGLNLFLNFLPHGPMPAGVAGVFFGVMASTHYLQVVAVFQVIPGLFLLFNRYVPMALAILAPVIFNILVVHTVIGPGGLHLLLAIIVALLWALVAHRHRAAFDVFFQKRAEV
jgi:hypothetical protein